MSIVDGRGAPIKPGRYVEATGETDYCIFEVCIVGGSLWFRHYCREQFYLLTDKIETSHWWRIKQYPWPAT